MRCPARTPLCAFVLLWGAGTLSAPAWAQEFPAKPIRIVVGFPPGGSNDIVARALATRIGTTLGQQLVVDNRPGANGIIAAEHVAKAAPDGYTVILTGVSTLVLNPLVYAKVPYDTLRDLSAVTTVAVVPQIIVAHPRLPVANLKDVVALAKRVPGELSAGSPGVGGISHLTLELFKSLGGAKIEHVSYKGTAPALTDLTGGHIPLLFCDLPAPIPLVKAGKLRGLAVTGERRSALLPEVATALEQGYPGLQVSNWLGVMGPGKLPPALAERLHALFVAAIDTAETRERFASVGVEPAPSAAPAAFASFLQTEFGRWSKVVRQAGIQLN